MNAPIRTYYPAWASCPGDFLCSELSDHVFPLKRISEPLIVSPDSDTGDDCNLPDLRIALPHQLFRFRDEPLPHPQMLSGSGRPVSEVQMITECVHLTDDGAILQLAYMMPLSGENLGRDPEPEMREESPVLGVDHLQIVFHSSARFVGRAVEDGPRRIIAFESDLAGGHIFRDDSCLPHPLFDDLPEIRKMRPGKDLIRGDIAIHSVQSHVFGDDRLDPDHEIDELLIRIRRESSLLPDLL